MRPIDADHLKERLPDLHGGITEILCKAVREIANSAPTIAPPPNDPLTPEQLRAMIGEPVWLSGSGLDRWDILSGISTDGLACFIRAALPMERCGKDWVPYRCKPVENT